MKKRPVKAPAKRTTKARSRRTTENELWTLDFRFHANQKSVDPVVQGIMKLVCSVDQDPEKTHAIELALTEGLANAVVHGAGSDGNKIIECRVVADRSREIAITVRDPGKGFNAAKLLDPMHEDNRLATHGRGIFLIKQLMDEVKFFAHGSEIRMVKR